MRKGDFQKSPFFLRFQPFFTQNRAVLPRFLSKLNFVGVYSLILAAQY